MLTFAIAELMRNAWSGDDDEDNPLLKKFKNMAMYQADRTYKELILFVPLVGTTQQYQMLKSPIASTRTMGELGEALTSSIITPWHAITQSEDEFWADTDVVYQRGSRAGQLKLWKQWQDAVPLLYTYKKWQSYNDMSNFFIK